MVAAAGAYVLARAAAAGRRYRRCSRGSRRRRRQDQLRGEMLIRRQACHRSYPIRTACLEDCDVQLRERSCVVDADVLEVSTESLQITVVL